MRVRQSLWHAGLLVLLPASLFLSACGKPSGFRLKYVVHTPPGPGKLEEYTDFKYEVRKKGDREFIVFQPRKVTQDRDGSIRAEYLIVLNPPPVGNEKYEVRSSYRRNGKLIDGEMREEVFVTVGATSPSSVSPGALAQVQARAPLTVWPRDLKAGETLPVAVWLHGYGADPTKIQTDALYQEVADRLHVAIVGVYAPNTLRGESFAWSELPTVDYEQVRQSLKLAEEEKGVHFGPRMVFGFSQGACVAAELAARHPEEFRGAICLSPGANTPPAPFASEAGNKAQVYYLSCGAEEAAGNVRFTESYADYLAKTGAAVHSRLVPGMATHGRPPDWPERFPEWLAAMLKGKS